MKDASVNITLAIPSSIQVPSTPSILSSAEFSSSDLCRRTSTISNSRFSPYPSQIVPNNQNPPPTSISQSTENDIHFASRSNAGNGILLLSVECLKVLVIMNWENQNRVAAKKTAFKQQFFRFLTAIADICTVCFYRKGAIKNPDHSFDVATCGKGLCIKCWDKHSGLSCGIRPNYPSNICWFCGLPQKLYGDDTHKNSATRQCRYKDRLLSLAWLSYWDTHTRTRWLKAFGLWNMDPSRFQIWLQTLATGEEFGHDAKVLNIVCLAMWVYDDIKQHKA